MSPPASALDVPFAVTKAAKRNPQVERVLQWGVRWLDRSAEQAHSSRFSELTEKQRIQVVETAAGEGAKLLPKAFYTIVRDLSMRAYYAHAAAWGGMGYGGPPQPDGFVDYRDAPMSRDK